MTRAHEHPTAADRHTPPAHTPRLRLKPKAPMCGFVDGAWWPHSRDLAAEMPDVLAVLSVRLGQIRCVMYSLDEWLQAPKNLLTGGHKIRLAGYHRQPINTVEVVGFNGKRIVLLVVSPQTAPDQAHATMMAAAQPDSALPVAELLLVSTATRATSDQLPA